MRTSLLAVVAVVAAFLGGTAALLVGKATGWVDDDPREALVVTRQAAEAEEQTETIGLPAGPRLAASEPLPGTGFDARAIYRERAGGVVTVISLFDDHADLFEGGTAQGSGFVVSEDGYILTNSHVITTAGEGGPGADVKPEAASRVFVEFRDGDRAEAKIVGWDVFDDVGLLKVNPRVHEVQPLPLGDSSRVVAGEPVAAIGSPFGQVNSLSVGVVGATERSIPSLTSDYSLVDAIQTDAEINRGNSGGPLLDARGRVIGINAQIRSESGTAEGVGFAVPINSAVRSMRQLIETGRVRYAWAGISTQTITPSIARRFRLGAPKGAAVQRVVEGSPADDAGLRAGDAERQWAGIPVFTGGDLIVAIDGRDVETAEDVVRAVTQRLPGERARFEILRGGRRVIVEVVLGERPQDPPQPR
jgi:2-alkenal reductase